MWTQSVTFKSEDVMLKGRWYFPVNTTENNKRPLVILVTGLGGNKDWFSPLAENLVGEGFAVFCFDFRGHGSSGGICNEKLRLDLETAVRYAKRHELVDSEKAFLVGQCVGGSLALHVANEGGGFAGVAIFSPLSEQNVIHNPDAWDKVMKAMNDSENPHKVRINEKDFLKLYKSLNLYSKLEKREIPVFVSFCTKDKYLTDSVRQEVSRRVSKPNDFLYIKQGGRHTAGYRESFIGKRLCAWLSRINKIKENYQRSLYE